MSPKRRYTKIIGLIGIQKGKLNTIEFIRQARHRILSFIQMCCYYVQFQELAKQSF